VSAPAAAQVRRSGVRAAVLDIEGTTGSLAYVQTVLFPYAARALPGWVAAQRGTPRWARLRAAVAEHAGAAGSAAMDDDTAVAQLLAWIDSDVKAAPLKEIQGLIWAAGYASGQLTAHVYPDVPPVLRAWRGAGIGCHVYSSGSRAAQRDWFAHTPSGDLTPLLERYFDLESAGAKTDPTSYRAIADALALPPGALVFLSDTSAELDAAREAGWQPVGVRRVDDPRSTAIPGHDTVASLDAIALVAASS
jgi:enolase-phosphatase E1